MTEKKSPAKKSQPRLRTAKPKPVAAITNRYAILLDTKKFDAMQDSLYALLQARTAESTALAIIQGSLNRIDALVAKLGNQYLALLKRCDRQDTQIDRMIAIQHLMLKRVHHTLADTIDHSIQESIRRDLKAPTLTDKAPHR